MNATKFWEPCIVCLIAGFLAVILGGLQGLERGWPMFLGIGTGSFLFTTILYRKGPFLQRLLVGVAAVHFVLIGGGLALLF